MNKMHLTLKVLDKPNQYLIFLQMVMILYLNNLKVKYSVDEPTVSTSFKEKVEERIGTDDREKDELIAKLKSKYFLAVLCQKAHRFKTSSVTAFVITYSRHLYSMNDDDNKYKR